MYILTAFSKYYSEKRKKDVATFSYVNLADGSAGQSYCDLDKVSLEACESVLTPAELKEIADKYKTVDLNFQPGFQGKAVVSGISVQE